MDEKKIGIVTVLYNSEKVLDDFFDSLKRQTYKNFILYVVDNASPDNSLEKSKELALSCNFEVKFIENKENYGVAKGNNQGIINALYDECDYVLLSNNDVVLLDDTIAKLYEGLISTCADMVVPKIYLYSSTKLWCAGGKMDRFNTRSVQYGYNAEDCVKYSKIRKISYAPTCFMLVKGSVFYDVGLMDEKYFVYYDDTDFVYRTQKQKKRLFYIPKSSMQHKESVCTGKRSNFFYKFIYRNKIYYLSKFNKFWRFFYLLDCVYNEIIRSLKMKDICQIENIKNALKEGYKLALSKNDN